MTTETETRTGIYEAMFVAGQAAAAQFGDLIDHINELFGRAGAEVVAMRKWDERRLAYEIEKQKRGVYILAYFTCPADALGGLERDVQISDKLFRVLITKADHLTDEEIASADDRQALQDEAKFRAEQGEAEAEQGQSKVRLGAPEVAPAPVAEAAPAEETPAEAPADVPSEG